MVAGLRIRHREAQRHRVEEGRRGERGARLAEVVADMEGQFVTADIQLMGVQQRLVGTAIGVGLGVVVALNIDVLVPAIERAFHVQFLPKSIYVISELPSELIWSDVYTIGGLAVVLAFLATLYPSWAAARVKPAEALRYE